MGNIVQEALKLTEGVWNAQQALGKARQALDWARDDYRETGDRSINLQSLERTAEDADNNARHVEMLLEECLSVMSTTERLTYDLDVTAERRALDVACKATAEKALLSDDAFPEFSF